MAKHQQGRVVRLETPVPCGFPDCTTQTQNTIYEEHSHGRYTAIELAPYCEAHEQEMWRLWTRRFGGGLR